MSRPIFFDTEFIEDGKTIDLISIGMVDLEGKELYLCNRECELDRASEWVQQNVFPHLPPLGESTWTTRAVIRKAVLDYCIGDGITRPEFWAYYADYDWVAFCQIFGKMIDLPSTFPKFCMDLKMLAVLKGNLLLPDQQNEHNALDDARWNREAYIFLSRHEFSGYPYPDKVLAEYLDGVS